MVRRQNSPLRVAAIGLGWVTQHRHMPSLRRSRDLRLCGVIDRRPGHARAVAQKHGVSLFAQTDDLSKVGWLDEIDAVTIGTAPMAHHHLVLQALARGKHVLTEKPFAMNVDEGEEMVETARLKNRVLAVMHNFQFSRAARKLERAMAAGSLGKVLRVAAVQTGNPRRRLPQWYPDLPFGLFYDESPHFFYLIRRLAQAPLKLVQAHSLRASGGGTTPASVSLTYRAQREDFLPLTVDCMFESPLSEWHVAVFGSARIGIVDIFRDIYISLPNDNAHALPDILRTSFLTTAQHWMQHIPNGIAYLRNRLDYGNDEVFRRFAQAMRRGERPQDIDAADALEVLRLQHEAIAVARETCV